MKLFYKNFEYLSGNERQQEDDQRDGQALRATTSEIRGGTYTFIHSYI